MIVGNRKLEGLHPLHAARELDLRDKGYPKVYLLCRVPRLPHRRRFQLEFRWIDRHRYEREWCCRRKRVDRDAEGERQRRPPAPEKGARRVRMRVHAND